MRVLVLDLGNSKSAVARLAEGRVEAWRRLEHAGPAAADEAELARLQRWCRDHAEGAAGMVIASVRPARLELWRRLWREDPATRSLALEVVDHRFRFPFAVAVEQPETVGPDRWCNLAGAVASGRSRALVVDLGTAHTFDLLWEGCFRGGLIAPGMGTAHRALLEAGALLPPVELDRPRVLVGRRTEEAIRAGSWWQGVEGVAGVIRRFRAEYPDLPVLLTGGRAASVAGDLEVEAELRPHLTLEGGAALSGRGPQGEAR